MTLKNGFGTVFVICFISQWVKRSKHGLFVFPPKKTLIWRRHCSIGQSCCSMTSKRSIDWFLESSRAWSFFTRVFTEPTKRHARFYPFDRPSKSLYFRSFVCFFFSVLFYAFSFQGHTKIALNWSPKGKCFDPFSNILSGNVWRSVSRICVWISGAWMVDRNRKINERLTKHVHKLFSDVVCPFTQSHSAQLLLRLFSFLLLHSVFS